MRLALDDGDRAFRDAARAWLAENRPRERPPADGPGHRAFVTGWLARCHAAGWSGLAWPVEHGGRGLLLRRLLIWHEECARARAPSPLDCSFVGLNHAGPTLIACGTEDQKRFHLPRILSGEAIWCQGFSEPGAGSDLAALRMTGRVEGEDLVISGQKIWTSYADLADHQELLVRTEPGSTRHHGLSWVICDMDAPGVTVRMIGNMAGARHFAEVFYDEVRVPLSNVVGGLGNGWATAMTTLGFERRTAAMALQLELSVRVEDLIARAGAAPGSALADRLAALRAEAAALRATTYRAVLGEVESPFYGSIVRLLFAELAQKVHRLSVEVMGPEALVGGPVSHDYLESYSETIAGGTAEIQRNIIAERLLGLPREPRP